VPQDERSVELGAAFKEAQIALRDARKALEKRKAEFDDEPEWMREQFTAAEQRFAEAASQWSEHLETTGRKVVRR
jgi:predicted translin family RNA/ssDNA-binding protein